MILDNLISKKDLEAELQNRYYDAKRESEEAKTIGHHFVETYYSGMAIACLRIAEDFDIKLKWE
jgi:hypothetical protein